MSSVDAAWWRMDRPHNPMVIVGVLRLNRAPTLKALRCVIGERLLAQPRFRQRPVHCHGADFWAVDAHFKLERHVVRRVLTAPAGEAQLEVLVGQRVTQALDAAHPLWEITLVPMADGAASVLLRIHHCYADGLALIRLLAEVSAGDPEASLAAGTGAAPYTPSPPVAQAPPGLLDDLMLLLTQAARAVDGGPQQAAGSPAHAGGAGGAGDAQTDLSLVARAFGCSINAVLLSCLAGALGAQLRSLGTDPRKVEIRVLLPSPLRSARRASAQAGNHFGLVNLALPLGITNPVARAWEVHRRIEALAGTRQALLMHLLLGVVGLLPGELQTRALDLLAGKATSLADDDLDPYGPGPPSARYLAGSRIDDIMFWVPQAGDIGIGISILSYDSRFRIGLMSDSALLPQPRQVLDRTLAEFARLLPLAQVMAEQQAGVLAPTEN